MSFILISVLKSFNHEWNLCAKKTFFGALKWTEAWEKRPSSDRAWQQHTMKFLIKVFSVSIRLTNGGDIEFQSNMVFFSVSWEEERNLSDNEKISISCCWIKRNLNLSLKFDFDFTMSDMWDSSRSESEFDVFFFFADKRIERDISCFAQIDVKLFPCLHYTPSAAGRQGLSATESDSLCRFAIWKREEKWSRFALHFAHLFFRHADVIAFL